ncbi:hypothetical protein GAR05_06139 [Micromonospora saelicesensis]|uniref:Uncharacterized protein n=1 Tax=Micromonospora saelicesensis TaxID=285676 RepID=A0ABX9CAC9_9ACTN|nr:hypothetical protein GAR05_06139 [Micromonospora saelicesensis]
MDDLVTWLCAQLDEDERAAKAATSAPWWHNPGKVWLDPEAFEQFDRAKGEEFVGYGESPLSGCVAATGPASHAQSMADAEHIARHDPARVLAEVDAKRRILDLMMPGRPVYPGAYGQAYRDVLRLLALPYADRPGYRDEWKP